MPSLEVSWNMSVKSMVPYSAEAFFELLASCNSAIWPGYLTTLLLSVLLLGLLLFQRPGGDQIIYGFLACGWAWTGFVFLMNHFVTLDWAGTYFGTVFVVQAGLLLCSGTIQERLNFRSTRVQHHGLVSCSS